MKQLLLASLLFTLTGPGFCQTLDSTFSQGGAKTDAQAAAAKDFVHTGLRDREIDECKKNGICDETKVDSVGSILGSSMLENQLGKGYVMLFGGMGFLTGGGGPTLTVNKSDKEKADEAAKVNKAKPVTPETETPTKGTDAAKLDQTKQANDYCLYGAMGYEMIATLMQTTGQQNNSNVSQDPQLQSLISLKEVHRTRQKTARYQAITYGATASCYAARLVLDHSVVKDWKIFTKMGGAALLATIYELKYKKHQAAADAVQKVIDALPKVGDCNPYTATTCFCAEKTSATSFPDQYQEICVLNKGKLTADVTTNACGVLVDGKMTLDKTCTCKKNNTCFRTQAKTFNPQFSLAKSFMTDANKGFDLLGKGEVSKAELDNYKLENSALAAKLKGIKDNGPAIKMTPEQKKIADALKDVLPPGLTAVAATSGSSFPPGSSASAPAPKLSNDLKKKVEDAHANLKFEAGAGFNTVKDATEEGFKMPGAAGEKTDNSTEVVSFAEKAMEKADVSNTPNKPIWDIITERYQRSGWKSLSGE